MDAAMAQAIRLDDRARQLAGRLRTDWIGERWDDIVIEDVALLSSPDRWPPVIQLDYRFGGTAGRWVETWDDHTLRSESLEVASELWLSIVSIHLMDLTEPPREHFKSAG
jgi:hypothetical protein